MACLKPKPKPKSADEILKEADALLSKHKTIPMDSEMIEKVKDVYKCLQVCDMLTTPLYLAVEGKFRYIVWGFLECAKQTNTNLQTGNVGEYQQFFGCADSYSYRIFSLAIENFDVEMLEIILPNASLELLISYRDSYGMTLVSWLSEWRNIDKIIFEALEVATRAKVDARPLTMISIDDQQRESISYIECMMDPNSYPTSHIYNSRMSLEKLDLGKLELTPNRNTILHLATKFGDMEYVKELFEKHPTLMYSCNIEGETPAYIASREGHVDILEMMINHFNSKHDDTESLLTRSTDKNSALHVAIQNHCVGVFFWLINEVPRLSNHINTSGQGPLYIAAQKEYHEFLKQMLEKCKKITFDGPDGKTALHVAAISGSSECVDILLHAKNDLLFVKDKRGWIPLYYAIHHGQLSVTKALLDKDSSIGYQVMASDDINAIPIHIAASRGHHEIVKVLMEKCHGSPESTNSSGRNILHVAIQNKQTEVIKVIVRNRCITSLINQKDNDGNTPIHLFMASDLEMEMGSFFPAPSWFSLTDTLVSERVDISALNNDKLTPLDVASSDEKRKKLKGLTLHEVRDADKETIYQQNIQESFKIRDSLLIVATLITTASFAAAFTVPGGFNSEDGSKQGTPILLGKSAFQAFVVANTIAFACSCSILFRNMALLIRHFNRKIDIEVMRDISETISWMYFLTGVAMLSMAIAFITGMYVVLAPSLGLAISVCIISISIIVFASVVPLRFLY